MSGTDTVPPIPASMQITLPMLKKRIEQFAPKVLKDVPECTIADPDDPDGELVFGMAVVYLGEEEVKSIARDYKLPCYVIGTIVVTPQTMWEPEEADFAETMTERNVWTAALRTILYHAELELDRIMEGEAQHEMWLEDQRLAAEFQNLPANRKLEV